ncbi:hypothetical protein [Caballeronia humi]|uniref:Lipoprotein n=1 Tax=Caballeronia humi TaxID=326474 RepID=A0A158J1X5_9BURK|nr:hypothetical protein [Caballeronia humi]SAL62864.1 hypothetical protein AWB65_05799 [Caballeronia humi]
MAQSKSFGIFHRATVPFMVGAIVANAHAQCPDWVVTPAGSAFNVAALIADNGSPQTALEKVSGALARVVNGGGCRTIVEPAACDETIELAKKAIAALERCTPENDPAKLHRQKGQRLEAEK